MLDWDHLQSFLMVARHGNLSAAARALRVTQTTMGRRIEALHAQAGVRLLQKTPEGFVLTQAGKRVLASVERIEIEALSVQRAITGEDERIAGEVRITTVDSFGAKMVIPMLQKLAQRQPELQIELIADNRSLSLSRREADIAIRLAEFEQHEVVVRHVADMAFGLYASKSYLQRHGMPDFKDGCAGHVVIALQQDLGLMPEAKRLAQVAPRAAVALRSNSRDVHVHAVQTGYGIAFLPCYLAMEGDELVELSAPGGRVVRGLWLGVHRDTRDVRRIRLVLDHLVKEMKGSSARLMPAPMRRR
ncbi:LysR family transcriptional regulator [Bradyrhizobium sp. B117]|uniref:LysR family transcriptional regulator n=1 Tax=Bradyrhizobium sp. B117 TaxID=3140246 RepID=UPI0031832A7C